MEKQASERFFRRTVSALRQNGNSSVMAYAVMNHAKVLQSVLENKYNFMHQDEACLALIAKLFFERIEMYPKDKHATKMDENYPWPVQVLPSEIFRDLELTSNMRRNLFFRDIKTGDVVITRVVSFTSVSYLLKVIHKYDSRRILEDLNIEVLMDKAQLNFIHEREIPAGDCYAVVISDIQKVGREETKLFASLDGALQDKRFKRKLGKITDEELPCYILNPPDLLHISSYNEYISSVPAFHNHLLVHKVYSDFGIDINKIYSFHPKFANMNCEADYVNFPPMMKSKERDITRYLDKAYKERQIGNHKKALEHVQSALNIDPNYVKTYEARSLIYLDMDDMYLKAYKDWCHILTFNKTSTHVRENFSKLLCKTAYKFYKAKNYARAAEIGQHALVFNSENNSASVLLEYLKKKHPEVFLDSDENTLQSVKEKIVAQLKELD